jgi:hypothetical protein
MRQVTQFSEPTSCRIDIEMVVICVFGEVVCFGLRNLDSLHPAENKAPAIQYNPTIQATVTATLVVRTAIASNASASLDD